MLKIKCPCCNQIIEVENTHTYYYKHKESIQEKYRENKKDPEFVERKREIALRSYHKRKKECQTKL